MFPRSCCKGLLVYRIGNRQGLDVFTVTDHVCAQDDLHDASTCDLVVSLFKDLQDVGGGITENLEKSGAVQVFQDRLVVVLQSQCMRGLDQELIVHAQVIHVMAQGSYQQPKDRHLREDGVGVDSMQVQPDFGQHVQPMTEVMKRIGLVFALNHRDELHERLLHALSPDPSSTAARVGHDVQRHSALHLVGLLKEVEAAMLQLFPHLCTHSSRMVLTFVSSLQRHDRCLCLVILFYTCKIVQEHSLFLVVGATRLQHSGFKDVHNLYQNLL
mmetsp:Transcript_9472/g.20978  ORF Transcript_9472/g.20978 Transcript_9472/m.20978 type:complete len:271 (-) Transcript_9472:996-1808(-)